MGKEGLSGTYQVLPAGASIAEEVASGRMELGKEGRGKRDIHKIIS